MRCFKSQWVLPGSYMLIACCLASELSGIVPLARFHFGRRFYNEIRSRSFLGGAHLQSTDATWLCFHCTHLLISRQLEDLLSDHSHVGTLIVGGNFSHQQMHFVIRHVDMVRLFQLAESFNRKWFGIFLLPQRWPWCAASWRLHHLQYPISWWLAPHCQRERAYWCTQGKWVHLAISHQSLKRADLHMDKQFDTPSQQLSGSPSTGSCVPSAGSGHCILCTTQAVQLRLETDILAIAQLLFHSLASATHRKRQQAHWIVTCQLCGCLSLASRPLDAWSKFLLDHVSVGVWVVAPWKLQPPELEDSVRRPEFFQSLQCDLLDSLLPK